MGDALGEARLARPLVGHAVAAPVAGERGLPKEDVWERPKVGEGLAKPAQSCCWLGARGPLCPQWGWPGWCSQCCPHGLGLGHPVLQTRMRERGQPYPDTLFRRRSNNLFRRRSGDVAVAAGTRQNRLLGRRRNTGK